MVRWLKPGPLDRFKVCHAPVKFELHNRIHRIPVLLGHGNHDPGVRLPGVVEVGLGLLQVALAGKRVVAGSYIDTSGVHDKKREALAAHRSQRKWLEKSQGMDNYLAIMDELSREAGKQSGKFEFAEGWRRRLHHGFSASEVDPLKDALGDRCLINEAYEASLETP